MDITYKLAIHCSGNKSFRPYNDYVFICFLSQALFGILLLVYIPALDPYPGYHILNNESLDSVEYDALRGGENICPERYASIFSGR